MAAADTSREDDVIEDAKAEFARATEAWSDNYNNALEDFRFARLSEQWPEKVRKQRELEGRPCLTINKLPAFIRQVVNDARQNKPSIRTHPVDSNADPETAEVYNGLIRHIEQSSDADVAYDTAIDHSATGGFGYFKINTRYASDDGFEQDVVIEPVANPFSIVPDPDTTAADSSDWNVAFEIDSLTKKAFERRWDGADAVSFDASNLARKQTEAGERVQIAYQWLRTETKRRILALKPTRAISEDEQAQLGGALPESMIIEEAVYKAQKALFDALGYEVVGQPRDVSSHKVEQRILSGCDVLETIPWAGKWIPIIPVYGEDLNVEGQRHLSGLVRSAQDAQRQFNFWRTASTELVALAPKAPFIGRAGQFETDAAKWATANNQSHAYIEYDVPEGQADIGPPQRQPFAGVPAGALQEALNASDDMKSILGIYDASLGARSNETSGRAIMARQRESDVGTFHYIDNLSRAIRHAGRILLDLIPKVYSTPRVARVLGPEGEVKTVRLAPKAMAEQEAPQPEIAEGMEEAGEVARIYSLDVGKYDLTVSAGPSFTSRREESASQMIELIRAYPNAAPLIGDLLAKNLDWPGADEIAERMQKMLPAQLQGDSPEAQQAQAQIQEMAKIIGQAKAEIQALKADKSLDERKLEIDGFNAETNRLKAVIPKGAPFDPMQMQAVIAQSLEHLVNSPDILEAAGQGAPPEQLAQMLAARMQPQDQQPPQMAA